MGTAIREGKVSNYEPLIDSLKLSIPTTATFSPRQSGRGLRSS
jgi:hypothetical protein